MTSRSDDRINIITQTLKDHVRGDWSDQTYTCKGCYKRHQHLVDTKQIPLDKTVLYKHIKPDWTIDQYNTHVAEHLNINLTNTDHTTP